MRNPALTSAPTASDRRSRDDLARIAVSVVVATILAAQAVISFTYTGGQTFPIVAYPMFKYAHYEGERLNDYRIYISADGAGGTLLSPKEMEISPWQYQNSITLRLINGEPSPLAASVAAKACAAGDAAAITIGVYDSGYTIRRDGPVSDAKKLMGAATYDCSAF
jgi:hypothetical protein